ncbi:MAG TPA: signal peptidase I [Micromonosporaceae bacterium]|nr:signal peptidase I [Micromonosporaceae bacterium]
MTAGDMGRKRAVPAHHTRGSWWQRAVRRRQRMPLWQEILLLIVVAFFLAVLVRSFAVQAFVIPGGSMSDTLRVGDRVLVNKLVYDFRTPRRGEIVVFRGTNTWTPEVTSDRNAGFGAHVATALGDLVGISAPDQNDFIKRVIGLPGDTVACCDVKGRVIVNGVGIDEPYVTANAPLDTSPDAPLCSTRRFPPVVVGPGEMFVLGDHRVDSEDSRCRGQVPMDHVIGKATAIIWPGGRFTWLSVPASFGSIPAATAAGPVRRVPVGPPVSGDLASPIVALCALCARFSHRGRNWRRTLRE